MRGSIVALVGAAAVLAACGGGEGGGEESVGAAAPVFTGPEAQVAAPEDGAEGAPSIDEQIAADLDRNIDPHRGTAYGARVGTIDVGGGIARIRTALPPGNPASEQYVGYICAAAYGPSGKKGVPGLREARVLLRDGKTSLSCDEVPFPAGAAR